MQSRVIVKKNALDYMLDTQIHKAAGNILVNKLEQRNLKNRPYHFYIFCQQANYIQSHHSVSNWHISLRAWNSLQRINFHIASEFEKDSKRCTSKRREMSLVAVLI